MDEKKNLNPHHMVMENREKLTLTGVVDIHSFDDELVLVETNMGILTVKGNDLKMNKLNLDNNELIVEGKIMALVYSEAELNKKGGVFGKIFK